MPCSQPLILHARESRVGLPARLARFASFQVNVVAPNYLYSEAYYPRARFIDDPLGSAEIAAKVPLGRLGRPEEIGELIAFLASGRAPFVTGQVIDFTGMDEPRSPEAHITWER